MILNNIEDFPNGSTKFCFLYGDFLKNSPSPQLHSKWFKEHKKNILYLAYEIQTEKEFKQALKAHLNCQNFHGANITKPFKNLITKNKLLKKTQLVLKTGSANTLYKDEKNEWTLDNTDIHGIKVTLETLMPKNEEYNLILLGGGGAAASCLYYAKEMTSLCKSITCFTRDSFKTKKNFPIFKNNISFLKLDSSSFQKLNSNQINPNLKTLIVNTVPEQGANSEYTQFAMQVIKNFSSKDILLFDMIYTETEILNFAKNLSVPCLNGSVMLAEQAKKSFYLWAGEASFANQDQSSF